MGAIGAGDKEVDTVEQTTVFAMTTQTGERIAGKGEQIPVGALDANAPPKLRQGPRLGEWLTAGEGDAGQGGVESQQVVCQPRYGNCLAGVEGLQLLGDASGAAERATRHPKRHPATRSKGLDRVGDARESERRGGVQCNSHFCLALSGVTLFLAGRSGIEP